MTIGTGSIKGQIQLEGVRDYSGTEVALVNSELPPAKTDSQGNFSFFNVPSGSSSEGYKLLIKRAGYQNSLLNINQVEAGKAATFSEPIRLPQSSNPDAPPKPSQVVVNIENNPNITVNPNISINPTITVNPVNNNTIQQTLLPIVAPSAKPSNIPQPLNTQSLQVI